MTENDKNLIEELEKRLCWYRDEATEEEFDAEEVDAICVMLQKLSPIEEPHMSREEAYRNILRRVEEEDKAEGGSAGETDEAAKRDDGRKIRIFPGKRSYRAAVLFIGVFGAAVLSLNMVTYAREDKSLFTMILERVGVLKIVKEASSEDIILDVGEDAGIFYDSWVELNSEVKSKIIVPQYIPNGYELYGMYYYNLNNREKVMANYYNKGNGHLVILITLWEDGAGEYRESAIDENIYTLISEYSDENTLYYEHKDEYICMIFKENSFYRISGNLALEEMVKIGEGLSDNKLR